MTPEGAGLVADEPAEVEAVDGEDVALVEAAGLVAATLFEFLLTGFGAAGLLGVDDDVVLAESGLVLTLILIGSMTA